MTQKNSYIGIALSILGIFAGLLLFYLLTQNYMEVVTGKTAGGRPDEAVAVEVTHSMLGALGLIASALWGAVLYGFAKKQNWSWLWGSLAAALQLLAGFFPTIPAKSIDYPSVTMPVFIIALVLWAGMVYLGKVNRKVIILAFFAGIAYVLTYINGVAVISRYIHIPWEPANADILKGMYAVTQLACWLGAAAWLVFTFALFRNRSYTLPLGIMASLTTIITGYTLAAVELSSKGGVFSLYLPAAILSTILLIYLLTPGAEKLISENRPGLEP